MKKTLLLFVGIALLATACTNNQSNQAEYTPAKVIDMEHHMFTPEFLTHLKTRTEYPNYQKGFGIWYREGAALPIELPYIYSHLECTDGKTMAQMLTDVDELRIADMNCAGVTIASISTGSGIEDLPREEAVKYAKMTNDAVAAAVKQHPDRFVGTICLPTPYVEESVAELERAVKELGLKYWHTHSNYGGHYIYEEQFEPIFAKCAELGVPFYLHPTNPSCDYLTDSGLSFASAGFGFAVDVMKDAIRLIISGLFDRYPNLTMILGHMGEFFPFCMDRMDNRFGVGHETGMDPMLKNEKTFTEYFKNKNIMMTTSGIFNPEIVLLTIKEIGIDNIMLGTDYPYEDFKESVDFIKSLPISNEDKDKILYKNAEKFIK